MFSVKHLVTVSAGGKYRIMVIIIMMVMMHFASSLYYYSVGRVAFAFKLIFTQEM